MYLYISSLKVEVDLVTVQSEIAPQLLLSMKAGFVDLASCIILYSCHKYAQVLTLELYFVESKHLIWIRLFRVGFVIGIFLYLKRRTLVFYSTSVVILKNFLYIRF